MTPGIDVGSRVLITTSNWFYGPDGRMYNAVHGTVMAIKDDEQTLGIRTNRNSTNWYVQVGNITIAGCQIHYAIRADSVHLGPVLETTGSGKDRAAVEREGRIYNADSSA